MLIERKLGDIVRLGKTLTRFLFERVLLLICHLRVTICPIDGRLTNIIFGVFILYWGTKLWRASHINKVALNLAPLRNEIRLVLHCRHVAARELDHCALAVAERFHNAVFGR